MSLDMQEPGTYVCVYETTKSTADQLLPEAIVSNDRTLYGCVCLNMMKTFETYVCCTHTVYKRGFFTCVSGILPFS